MFFCSGKAGIQMTHLILLMAILIPFGPRWQAPADSTWVCGSYVYQKPYVFSRCEDSKRVDVRHLPGPCCWTYYSDGRLIVHLRWDYNCDSVITGSDLGYFGLEYGEDKKYNLSHFAMFADAWQDSAVMEVE